MIRSGRSKPTIFTGGFRVLASVDEVVVVCNRKGQKLEPWCLAAAEVRVGQGLSGVERGSSVELKKYRSSSLSQLLGISMQLWSCCVVNRL